jgi:mannose-6-phosphate isomerase-like protein (cupin superfamily)
MRKTKQEPWGKNEIVINDIQGGLSFRRLWIQAGYRTALTHHDKGRFCFYVALGRVHGELGGVPYVASEGETFCVSEGGDYWIGSKHEPSLVYAVGEYYDQELEQRGRAADGAGPLDREKLVVKKKSRARKWGLP